MINRTILLVPVCLLALSGCDATTDTVDPTAPTSATSSAAPVSAATSGPAAAPAIPSPSGDDALRAAVTAYSDAFLDGKPTVAYELFSERCRERLSLSSFTGIVTAAKQQYGKALPIRSYDAQVSGDLARVTYTYDVPALDQTKEPWVREKGEWRQDDC